MNKIEDKIVENFDGTKILKNDKNYKAIQKILSKDKKMKVSTTENYFIIQKYNHIRFEDMKEIEYKEKEEDFFYKIKH